MPRWLEAPLALLALLACAPLLAVLAVLVAAGSPGGPWHRQVRVGRGGEPFTCWKLRTMRVGAEVRGRLTIGAADARVTPIGRWLRRTKLDELPQLAHVVTGHMSLVGPRPEVPEFVDAADPLQARVLAARPGLVDPASLAFRAEGELLAAQADPERFYRERLLPQKLALSAEYLDARTTRRDLAVLAATARALLRSDRTGTGDRPAARP